MTNAPPLTPPWSDKPARNTKRLPHSDPVNPRIA